MQTNKNLTLRKMTKLQQQIDCFLLDSNNESIKEGFEHASAGLEVVIQELQKKKSVLSHQI